MAQKAYSRVLSDYEHADDFLRKSLHLNNEFSTKQFNDAVVAVASVEMMTERVIGKNTIVQLIECLSTKLMNRE